MDDEQSLLNEPEPEPRPNAAAQAFAHHDARSAPRNLASAMWVVTLGQDRLRLGEQSD
jgi:hypothetical protein